MTEQPATRSASTHTGGRPGSAHPDPASPRPGLRALWALSKAGDEHLQTLVDLVQDLCDVPLAALAIFEGEDYHLNITAGIDPLVCDAQDSLCVQVMGTDETVHVGDVRADGRFDASPYVDGRLMGIGFYASAPVHDPSGVMVGRLCVFDLEPRELTPTQLRALSAVAGDVTNLIELHLRREADRPMRHEAGSDEVLRIAAQIGHDLRTPLTAVVTSLEMLAETEPSADPSRRRILNGAHRTARHLTGVVDGILRLSSIAQTAEPVPVELGAVVDQVLGDCALLLRTAGAQVEVGDLPTVVADPDQLYAVVLNLVSNAVKFSRLGVAPEIQVSAEPAGEGWRVLVSDNGVGIPVPEREEVFQLPTRLRSLSRGHGMGLATVERVVRAHGGRAGVDDSLLGGVTIWFEVPGRPPAGD